MKDCDDILFGTFAKRSLARSISKRFLFESKAALSSQKIEVWKFQISIEILDLMNGDVRRYISLQTNREFPSMQSSANGSTENPWIACFLFFSYGPPEKGLRKQDYFSIFISCGCLFLRYTLYHYLHISLLCVFLKCVFLFTHLVIY